MGILRTGCRWWPSLPTRAGSGAGGSTPPPSSRRAPPRAPGCPSRPASGGLVRRAGLPPSPCLRRTDRGRRQVGAGRSTRRSSGRFTAVATAPPPRAAVLVDDVHTTGATLDVCARALKAGGAEWVGAITYVRTL